MSSEPSVFAIPAINDAIDRQPIIVSPDTSLTEVIIRLSQVQGRQCNLLDPPSASDEFDPSFDPSLEARTTCALVMEPGKLLGIFTERDIVSLTATGLDFAHVSIADVMASPVVTLPLANFQDIFAALFLFRRYQIRNLPIVDDEGELVGVVSPSTIRRVLRPAHLLKLRRVSEVMTAPVVHSPSTASVLSLARRMAEEQVSCMVITEATNHGGFHPVGIVTERDIVQFQALQLKLDTLSAATVMSTPLFLLSPHQTLWEAHQEMYRRRVRRLVVSWNQGRELGIVTQTSVLQVFDPMEMYSVIETLQQTVQTEESLPGSSTAKDRVILTQSSSAAPSRRCAVHDVDQVSAVDATQTPAVDLATCAVEAGDVADQRLQAPLDIDSMNATALSRELDQDDEPIAPTNPMLGSQLFPERSPAQTPGQAPLHTSVQPPVSLGMASSDTGSSQSIDAQFEQLNQLLTELLGQPSPASPTVQQALTALQGLRQSVAQQAYQISIHYSPPSDPQSYVLGRSPTEDSSQDRSRA